MKHSIRRLLSPVPLLALGLSFSLLAACSDDPDEIVAAGDETQTPIDDRPPEDDPVSDADNDDATPDPTPDDRWERTRVRSDLIQTQAVVPLEVVADPDDDTVLLVRYEGAAEPCSGVDVIVEESADAIEVQLLSGLDPNVAAMSCIAGVFDYEVAVPLASAVGDREIVIASP